MTKGIFFLQADGHRLRAKRVGEPGGSAPPLVFLHEGLGSIRQWRDFPDALCRATGCPGLVYERWGYGGSDALVLPRPDDFLEREAERALPEVLQACAIERPILIGHSDGGTIALLYAAEFPERPLGLITEAAHVHLDEVTREGIAGVVRSWRETDLRARLERHHGTNTESMFQGWFETWQRPSRRSWSIEPRLPLVTCPVLAIQGQDDEHGLPAQVEAIVRGVSGPAETFMVPACGHVPHHQAREAVLERMARFARALRSG